jgi:hypothetical protein
LSSGVRQRALAGLDPPARPQTARVALPAAIPSLDGTIK